ncbi:MAG: hypothetical protein QOH56_1594 [Pseudonocardiales bacterium]|jgi:hypothetical protein|nr:hypothetical protein [Pseudonocardiales bacterium]
MADSISWPSNASLTSADGHRRRCPGSTGCRAVLREASRRWGHRIQARRAPGRARCRLGPGLERPTSLSTLSSSSTGRLLSGLRSMSAMPLRNTWTSRSRTWQTQPSGPSAAGRDQPKSNLRTTFGSCLTRLVTPSASSTRTGWRMDASSATDGESNQVRTNLLARQSSLATGLRSRSTSAPAPADR